MPDLTIIAGAVGLPWGAAMLVRGSLVIMALSTILVAACFGFDFWHARLGGVPLTIDRLAELLLLGAFVVQTMLRRTDPKPVRMTDRCLGLLLVYLTISTFTHDYHVELPHDVSPPWRLSAAYLMPGAVYWIARQSPLTEGRLALVTKVLTLFGLYLAVTGILEINHQWSLVFPQQIADPSLGIHFGRARGPMLTSVSYGLYLAVCLLAAIYWLPRLSRFGQLALIATFPLFFASLFFSYTRSVWIGIALGLTITAGVALRGRLRGAVLALLIVGLAGIGIVQSENIVGFKREQSVEETRNSAEWRKIFAYVSWEMFEEKPFFGVGFGQFHREKLPFLSDRSTDMHLQSIRDYVHHNTFLCLLTETGALGLLLFLLICIGWIRDGWTLWRSPVTPPWARRHAMLVLGAMGIYASQLSFHELSYSPLDNLLIFFLAGIQAGLRPLASAVPEHLSLAARYETFFSRAPARSASADISAAAFPS
jgi:O-antigen ligase